MSRPLDFATPALAVRAMLDAGALFSVRYRDDGLGVSFTYRVAEDGNLDRCRAILAAVKEKPPVFFEAFRAAVQDVVRVGENVGGASAPPISATQVPRRDRRRHA